MRCRFASCSSLALLSLLVTGCGSSPIVATPDLGPDQATVARRESRQNAFPLETGRFLGFAESATAFIEPKIDYSIEVVGPAPQVGAEVVEVIDPETRSFLLSDKRGVRIVALSERTRGPIRRLIRPMWLVTYPLRVGRVWESRYGRGKKTLNVRHWVADRLVVRTPEGSFDVYQIERRVWQGTYRPDFNADGLGRWTFYYAPGVGPVQIGTRWPGITTQTYQLCATRATAFARSDSAVDGAPWRGLTAGLEPLVRE